MDTSPAPRQLLPLFQNVLPPSFWNEVMKRHRCVQHDGVYSMTVVVWLMIWQRLQGARSLAAAVQHLLQGGADHLVSPCLSLIHI